MEQNGASPTSVVTVTTNEGAKPCQPAKIEAPTRRSLRQAQRKKRKQCFIPKITIKPIVPPEPGAGMCGNSVRKQIHYFSQCLEFTSSVFTI